MEVGSNDEIHGSSLVSAQVNTANLSGLW